MSYNQNMKILQGKKALIIGGGRGINKEVARTFLTEGAKVFLVARTKSQLLATQKELSNLGEVNIFVADVSKLADMKRLKAKVLSKWKGLDILINGAAVSGPIGSVLDVDPKDWLKSIEITLCGTFYGINLFGPIMRKKGSGVIINYVGGGEGPFLNYTSYVAAKGGVMRLNETVAAELSSIPVRVNAVAPGSVDTGLLNHSGIRMNAIAPGAVNTQFLKDLLKAGPKKAGKENYERALKQKQNGGVPADKAAKLCLWLASDASTGITGKIFSAQWDPYQDLSKRIDEIMKSDVYTMRRVRPKDRGFDWDPFDPISK